MPPSLDQIVIDTFRGIYDRRSTGVIESLTEQVGYENLPEGYVRQQQNTIFTQGGFQNRPPVRYRYNLGGTITDLLLVAEGNVLILRVNDAYIAAILIKANYSFTTVGVATRKFGTTGYDTLISSNSESPYFVNSATGANRAVAGAAPATAPAAANGAAGKVEAGLHLITVAYETDSGFITKYRLPATQYTAPGALKINLTAIPVGPAGTIARNILATKVIHQFNGDTAAYEEFFVPGGRLADNVTTILTIDFYDTELVSSADYLNDLEASLTGYVYLTTYNNMAVYVINNSTIPGATILSLPGSFESISLVDGVISDISAKDTVTAFVYQGALYLISASGAVNAYRDNGGPPNTWKATPIATGITPLSSVSTSILNPPTIATIPSIWGAASNSTTDAKLVENGILISVREGIYLFQGSFSVKPLTWNIDGLWKSLVLSSIDAISSNPFKVVVDPNKKVFYVAPLGTLNVGLPTLYPPDYYKNAILVCDYSEGLSWDTVKWSIWKFPFTIGSINIYKNGTISGNTLMISSGQYIYTLGDSPLSNVFPPTVVPLSSMDEDHSSGVTVKKPFTVIYETGLLPLSNILGEEQIPHIRLTTRFVSDGVSPEQEVQFGLGISNYLRNYKYIVGDPQVNTWGINKSSVRDSFIWTFDVGPSTIYRPTELTDIRIFHVLKAATGLIR